MSYLIFIISLSAVSINAQAGEFNFFNRNLDGDGITLNSSGKVISDSNWKMTSEKEDLQIYTNVNRRSEDPFGLIKQTLGVFKRDGQIEKIASAGGGTGGSMSGFKDKKIAWNVSCTVKCTVTSKKICDFYARKLNVKDWEEAKRELDKCTSLASDFPEDVQKEYSELLKTYSIDLQKIRNRLGQLAGKAGIGVPNANDQQENAQVYAIARAIEECSKMPYGAIASRGKDTEKATVTK